MKPFSIKQVSLQDFLNYKNKIIKMDHDFFPFPWKEDSWNTVFTEKQMKTHKLFLLESTKNRLAGFAMYHTSTIEHKSELYKLVLDPAFRGEGLGKLLLETSLLAISQTGIMSCVLEVSTVNIPAVRLYQKSCFKILATRKHFYTNGDDAFTMEVILK